MLSQLSHKVEQPSFLSITLTLTLTNDNACNWPLNDHLFSFNPYTWYVTSCAIPLATAQYRKAILYVCHNVTGYWKTNHNVTLGQMRFIIATHIHVHYPCTVVLPGLADWSFLELHGCANHVKSWLRQWGPWRELGGRNIGVWYSPYVSRMSLRLSRFIWAYD